MTRPAGPALIGRESEHAATQGFLAAPDGPAALVLEGPAGIGKSAIWLAAVQAARDAGRTVRTCRCSEPEAAWSFAGLGDLLEGLEPSALAYLPAIQRRALSAALLLDEPGDASPGNRVVGVAVLGVLRALAADGPVVLGIDDVQWLDTASERVLSFALRRLAGEPVRLLTTCRRETGTAGHPGSALGLASTRLDVGAVSVGVLQRIVRAELGATLARPALTRLHQATGGNPMLALEMGRALQRRGHELTADEVLSVPADFALLVRDRLHGLSPETRQLLLAAGALAHPTVEGLAAATGDARTVNRCLAEAVAAHVLELDGDRVRFTHPLLASVPYAELAPEERKRLHARLAGAVTDAEEHARHVALATPRGSRTVATALDGAAASARRRGSLDTAAELAELAVRRTPAGDRAGRLRRSVTAAEYTFRLGDPSRARATLTAGLAASRPGPERVPGLLLAATIASWESGDATVAAWCERAIAEAGADPLLLAHCHATLAETCPSGASTDLFHAQRAVELLDGMAAPPPELLASALTNLAVHACRLGRSLPVSLLKRAVELQRESPAVPVTDRAAMALGMYLKVVDRFDESRHWLSAMRRCALDEGDDMAVPMILGHLSIVETWAGDFELARQLGAAGREHAQRMEVRAPMPVSAHVLALAHQGRLAEARALGQRDLAADEALGYESAVALHLRSLGSAELFAGDPPAAAAHLLRAVTISRDEIGIGEPAILRLHGDAVDALVALGRLDEARHLTDELTASGAANRLPWSTAVGARCRGLLLVASGDRPAALEELAQALVDHDTLPMPFERARTQLLFGGVLRRHGHVSDARRAIEAARDGFVALGAAIHADQAAAELRRLGGRRPQSELTPVEERISALVADGRTNREVATALFLSVRTVDSHLSRIYRKLGVRSRTELSRLRTAPPPH